MEHEFETNTAFIDYAASALATQLTAPVARDLVTRIADDVTERRVPQGRAGAAPLRVPVVRWVIKDDDLKLLESLFDGLKAGAAAGLIVGEPTTATFAAGIVAIVAAVFKLGRQMRKKGRTLSELEYQVLAVLSSSADGLSESHLHTRLEVIAHRTIDIAVLRETLKALEAIALSDGSVTALVSLDAAGVYRASGV